MIHLALSVFALAVAISAVGALMGASAKLRRLQAPQPVAIAEDQIAPLPDRHPRRGRLAVPLATGLAVLTGVVGGFVVSPVLSGVPGEGPDPAVSPSSSASPTSTVVPSPFGGWKPMYTSFLMVIDVDCPREMGVDFDKPALTSDAAASDLLVTPGCSQAPTKLTLDAGIGWVPVDPDVEVVPQWCREMARVSTLGFEMDARQGDTNCFLLPKQAGQRDAPVVASLHVLSVTDGGAIQLALSAWRSE
ncbi:hypothetical protein AB0C07_39595 [Actinoplanes missouriensis]|uniref:hypothetical protein n=1 Tax=Actinoplanes missouriensis TaxID=1866 RepID=UPI0033BFB945